MLQVIIIEWIAPYEILKVLSQMATYVIYCQETNWEKIISFRPKYPHGIEGYWKS